MNYLVLGSTGNTGTHVANYLLNAGQKVRVIGRFEEKLKPFIEKGAEAMIGDLYDEEFTKQIFKGIDAAYLVTPPSFNVENLLEHQNRIGKNIIKALEVSDTRFAVHLSSYGYKKLEKAGPAYGIHLQEKRLNQQNKVKVLHLRAGFFMENLLSNIPLIHHNNFGAFMIDENVSMAMVATRDVGEIAGQKLMDLGFKHQQVQYALGKENTNFKEAMKALGNAIGKEDTAYVKLPYDKGLKAMINAGFSKDMAQSFINMSRESNLGRNIVPDRENSNTSKTSITDFAKEVFAPIYQQSLT